MFNYAATLTQIGYYRRQFKQELQEVLKFPIEIFWNLEASLISELSYF